MKARNTARRGSILAAALVVGTLLAACGDDEDTSSNDTTADTEAPADTGGETGDNAELCALATEMFNQDTPPSAEQLTQYQALAPDEISDAVGTAAPPLIAAGDDIVAFYNAFAKDEVEAAIVAIDTWEMENCGLDHEDTAPLPEGVVRDVEDDAARVDVVATEYAFDAPTTLEAGRTSFVLDNQGEEAHFLVIGKLAEGVDLETAMAAEDDSSFEGFWESGVAATGGDEEAITFDLEPGNYAILCFAPGPDGTPHAFMGMQAEFTVS